MTRVVRSEKSGAELTSTGLKTTGVELCGPFTLRLSRKARAWLRHSERYKRWATTAAVKNDAKVSVWVCFAAHAVAAHMYLASGTLDKAQCKEVMTHQVVPSAQRLLSLESWHSQHDSDPKHTAKTAQAWLWPSGTPLLS